MGKAFLPKEIEEIIYEYIWQLEHSSKWRLVCFELEEMYWVRKRVRLNLQFRSIYFPGFYQDVWMNPNPLLEF